MFNSRKIKQLENIVEDLTKRILKIETPFKFEIDDIVLVQERKGSYQVVSREQRIIKSLEISKFICVNLYTLINDSGCLAIAHEYDLILKTISKKRKK
jgi:hypothetical protein